MIVHEVPADVAADWVACLAELDEIRRNKTAKVKTREGPDYSYNFADLASVLGYVRPILASHGLAVSQTIDDGPTVTTQVWHRSGHMFELGGATVKPTKGDPQSMGSAITYARRYSLLSALDLATEDDDGKAASAPVRAPRATQAPQERPPAVQGERKTPVQVKRAAMFAVMNRKGITVPDKQHEFIDTVMGRHVESSKDLTMDELGLVLDALNALDDVTEGQ